jgi:hypothetical protein
VPNLDEIDLDTIESPTLRRLIEEVKREDIEYSEWVASPDTAPQPQAYNRMHNRHNRWSPGGGRYNRMHNRHNRSR